MRQKAKYTDPCIRCGTCCTLSLCQAAELAFPDWTAPCPALFRDESDGPTCCGLVMVEKHFTGGDLLSKSLGIGCGCSCPDNETTYAEIEAFDQHSYAKMYGTHAPDDPR